MINDTQNQHLVARKSIYILTLDFYFWILVQVKNDILFLI